MLFRHSYDTFVLLFIQKEALVADLTWLPVNISLSASEVRQFELRLQTPADSTKAGQENYLEALVCLLWHLLDTKQFSIAQAKARANEARVKGMPNSHDLRRRRVFGEAKFVVGKLCANMALIGQAARVGEDLTRDPRNRSDDAERTAALGLWGRSLSVLMQMDPSKVAALRTIGLDVTTTLNTELEAIAMNQQHPLYQDAPRWVYELSDVISMLEHAITGIP